MVVPFECGRVLHPDTQCQEQNCVQGQSLLGTLVDCCFARTAIPQRWRDQLTLVTDANSPGDNCCCDPEMEAIPGPSYGDEQRDTSATIGSDDIDANNNDDNSGRPWWQEFLTNIHELNASGIYLHRYS